MHPRNPYRSPPNFQALGEAYTPLQDHLIPSDSAPGGKTIDFKDDASQRRLTEAILCRDFGLKLQLPDNRLCPPIPNRLNYVLWIQDVVRAHPGLLKEQGTGTSTVRGIDIGTGASAIYPLLACKLEPNWEFIATDIDDYSLLHAKSNIGINGLQGRIKISRSTPDGSILRHLSEDSGVTFDFTMCNPPFYGSLDEVTQSADAKEFPPNAVCTGADVEMITHGGESGFVGRIVQESETTRTRCRWYTSMLGKMGSVFEVVRMLQERSITNYAITEFVQGQTRRWAIGWSFTDAHLPDSIARIPNPALQRIMPTRNTLEQPFQVAKHTESDELNKILLKVFDSIDGLAVEPRYSDRNSKSARSGSLLSSFVLVQATENTWSRSVRRRRRQVTDQTADSPERLTPKTQTQVPDPLVCSVRWSSESGGSPNGGGGIQICLEFQWIYGRERALYESFVGHVSRKVGYFIGG